MTETQDEYDELHGDRAVLQLQELFARGWEARSVPVECEDGEVRSRVMLTLRQALAHFRICLAVPSHRPVRIVNVDTLNVLMETHPGGEDEQQAIRECTEFMNKLFRLEGEDA